MIIHIFLFILISFIPILSAEDLEIVRTDETLIERAVENNDYQLIDILMKYPALSYSPVLNQAMNAEDYTAVQILIEYGVDINSRSKSFTNCTNESIKAHKNYIDGDGKTILEVAIERNELGLIDFFLSRGVDPTLLREWRERDYNHRILEQGKKSAVADVIELGRADILQIFGENGVDLNKPCVISGSKITPIERAHALKNKKCIEVLLSFKVKI